MKPTGERFIPQFMSGQISVEHFSRYLFVSNYLPLAGKTVLDIASGSGYGSFLLAKRANKVIGVDVSQEAVDYSTFHYSLKNLSFIQGDCCNIPLEDHSIDVLVSFETIEHIECHEVFFNEIKRVLRADGIVVMSSPNKKLYSDIPGRSNPFHVKELYNEEFISLITKHFQFFDYFGQSYQLASVIFHIDGSLKPSERPADFFDETVVEKEPLYNLVIASNTEMKGIRPIPLALFYEDNSSIEQLCQIAYERGRMDCHNTKTWKLGHFLISPALCIKRVFRK